MHHSERIERLREVQPEMAALRRPKLGRQRVGRDLERGESAGKHEQCGEDRPEIAGSRC